MNMHISAGPLGPPSCGVRNGISKITIILLSLWDSKIMRFLILTTISMGPEPVERGEGGHSIVFPNTKTYQTNTKATFQAACCQHPNSTPLEPQNPPQTSPGATPRVKIQKNMLRYQNLCVHCRKQFLSNRWSSICVAQSLTKRKENTYPKGLAKQHCKSKHNHPRSSQN